jgi:hypothetical protein
MEIGLNATLFRRGFTPVSILCFSCLMIYHDEIHFTTLYIAELGTRAETMGEGARAEKGEGKERQLQGWVDYKIFVVRYNYSYFKNM